MRKEFPVLSTGTENIISYNPENQGFFSIDSFLGRIGFIFHLQTDKIQRILFPGFKALPSSLCSCSHKPLLKQFLEALPLKGPLPEIPDRVLDWTGLTPFQNSILRYLKNHSRRGQLISYSELALKAGFPKAARACGGALAVNPFPLVIPCHRVICQNGGMGGFMGNKKNIVLKKHLLRAEGVFIP